MTSRRFRWCPNNCGKKCLAERDFNFLGWRCQYCEQLFSKEEMRVLNTMQ